MVPTLRFVASVAALLVISASAQSNCDRFYAVNSGDTCNSIAAQQHVPTFQLQTVNNGTIDAACDNLFPGEGEDCETTYVVQSGDTCVAISSDNNIPFATLLANNPNVNSDCTNIGVGEVLCVADQIIGAAESSQSTATSSSIPTRTVPVSSTPPASQPFACPTGPVDSSQTIPLSCLPFTTSVSSVDPSATVPVAIQTLTVSTVSARSSAIALDI